MAEVIQANYEQLEEIKAKFGQEAEAAQSMQQNLAGAFKPLEDGGWLGRGADAFFNEMNGEILPAVRRFIEALLKANQVTGEIAESKVIRRQGKGDSVQLSLPIHAVEPLHRKRSSVELEGRFTARMPSLDVRNHIICDT